MGKGSVFEEYKMLIKENKLALHELSEKVSYIDRWKNSFEHFYTQSISDMKKSIGDTVSREELLKHDDQQVDLYELKLNECKNQLAKLQGYIIELRTTKHNEEIHLTINKLKEHIISLEGKINSFKQSEVHKNCIEVSNRMNVRLEKAEQAIKTLEQQCVKISNKNNKLVQELEAVKNSKVIESKKKSLVMKRLLGLEKRNEIEHEFCLKVNNKLERLEKKFAELTSLIHESIKEPINIKDELFEGIKDSFNNTYNNNEDADQCEVNDKYHSEIDKSKRNNIKKEEVLRDEVEDFDAENHSISNGNKSEDMNKRIVITTGLSNVIKDIDNCNEPIISSKAALIKNEVLKEESIDNKDVLDIISYEDSKEVKKNEVTQKSNNVSNEFEDEWFV